MDPISIIVMAVALGAAAGLKPTAEQVIKDAYAGLKTLIQRKYAQANESVALIEAAPQSKARQQVMIEDLEKASADKDEELLRQAKTLLDAMQKADPDSAKSIGVSLEDIKAASLKIDDVIASGAGVQVKKAEITGDINISKVRAGGTGAAGPKA